MIGQFSGKHIRIPYKDIEYLKEKRIVYPLVQTRTEIKGI